LKRLVDTISKLSAKTLSEAFPPLKPSPAAGRHKARARQGKIRCAERHRPALGAAMSPAWVHGSLRVDELALPKSVESGNISVNKAVIGWRLA
jgi:hypothetical protein